MSRPPIHLLIGLLAFVGIAGVPHAPAAPDLRRVGVGDLGVELVEHEGWFLGIGRVEVAGVPLREGSTTVLPFVHADWAGPPRGFSAMRLSRVQEREDGFDLELELHADGAPGTVTGFLGAEEDGAIARDDFLFARVAPVAGAVERGRLAALAGSRRAPGEPVGRLTWRVRLLRRDIAGWPWTGFRWWFEGELDENQPEINAHRVLGSWELGGSLEGLTVANQRYRGLGEPAWTFAAPGGVADAAWNTQDLIPPGGLAGTATLDRDAVLELRSKAWIHAPARGAGTGFLLAQHRPAGGLVVFPERQGNLRTLAEVIPGDRHVGVADEEHFAATRRWATVPMHHLVLAPEGGPRDPAFWQTRYLEVERAVRAQVAAELGFVETPVVPSLGLLIDIWRAGDAFGPVVARVGSHAGRWHELGVRRLVVHNPGWQNGRAAERGWDGADPASFTGGGVNDIYDWWPLPRVESAWANTHAALRELGIEYFVWLTGMSREGQGFARLVGDDPAAWASNAPDGTAAGYTAQLLKHNVLSPTFRAQLDARLDAVRGRFGFEGIWGDSFQNLYMSQLDWVGSRGAPQQRAWWEWLAERSRGGQGWIAESQSFPGINCSIETDGWDRHPWLLAHTTKWLRGHHQYDRSAKGWTPLAYRLMAFGSWLMPEAWPYEITRQVEPDTIIEDFARLAHEFLAARPDMARCHVLPGDRGVLWLPDGDDTRGVLFPFARFALPEGVEGAGILASGAGSTRVALPLRTLAVRAADLLEAFGLERGPVPHEPPVPPVPAAVAASASPAHPPVARHAPIPGRHQETRWDAEAPIWVLPGEAEASAWPGGGDHRAVFPAGTRVVLPLGDTVRAAGVQVATPGVDLVIDTERDGGPGDALVLDGPLLGPATVYFRGSLRDGSWPHDPRRLDVGLQFRGGDELDLEAALRPWPGGRHLHSPVVGLDGPGTTVHFRGTWEGDGELCRPGLVLGDGTRFVIWPEARLPFVKDYGGFTLQLWVTGVGERGGVLELHPEFEADRSRFRVARERPAAADLGGEALGSIRIGGATLVTHASRNLPMTGRETGDPARIQDNGHLVFEHRDGNRWEVRTHEQSYRGAVWIHRGVTIVTARTLVHEGVTQAPDARFGYVAANAFQTVRTARDGDAPIIIRKEGPADLVLAGEQAYVPGSVIQVAEGRLVLRGDPAAGGAFPSGQPHADANLDLVVLPGGTLVVDTPLARVRSLRVDPGSTLVWARAAEIRIAATGESLRGEP